MKYLDTKSEDSCVCFAIEEYISEINPCTEALFLLWRTLPTLMVGNFQNVHTQINEEYANATGIKTVRRRSGGGTIFTDMNTWQYTYWIPGKTHGEADFRSCSAPVVDALRKMGVPAEFNGRNDVLVAGKKICGNARYCTKYGVIHHGSLIFDTDIEMMVRALNVSDEKIISKGVKSVRQHVAKIRNYLNRDMSSEDFAKNLIRLVFCETPDEYTLDETAWESVKKIAEDKYRSWAWNYGENPRFEKKAEKRFSCGLVSVGFDVEHEHFKRFEIGGDFFSDSDVRGFCSAVEGCAYNTEAFVKNAANKGFDLSGIINGLSSDELTGLIFGD